MTAYITITDAETDPEAPLTSELAKKWRDNPIAIAEKDASVPARLRLGAWLLGTINTTSGGSVTLSGLTLTNYSFLSFFVNGASTNGTNTSLLLNSYFVSPLTGATGNHVGYGGGWIDLNNGVFWSSGGYYSGTTLVSGLPGGGLSGVTTASTSITFTCSGGSSFDAGSIRIYGVR